MTITSNIRACREDDHTAIFEIINAAADAYRGVIPADCWHEPYMPPHELEDEIAAGVSFWGYEANSALLGVMGTQPRHDVDLIHHAYVRPEHQRRGIGASLLEHIKGMSTWRILVGTWEAAGWAIRFYRHHGFEQVSHERKNALLRTYWTVPEHQIETSVVLAHPPLDEP
jgi:GNAT superfamily N-acetyltransferase